MTGNPRVVFSKLITLRLIVLLSMFAALTGCKKAPRPALDLSQKRDLNVAVSLNRNFKDGKFQENERKNYRISLDGTGFADVFDSGAKIGRFRLSSDGYFEATGSHVPQELELIFHTLPPSTYNDTVRPGDGWSVVDPTDDDIRNEDGLISLQEKRDYVISDVVGQDPDEKIEWNVNGYLKLFDNSGLRKFVGPVKDPNSAGKKAIQALSQWNLYLTGSTSWSVQRRLPVKGEFTYILIPGSGRTKTVLENADNRQHLSFSTTF